MHFEQIVAIIPASGQGSRFGQPKLNAPLRGKPFIEHICETLSQTGITEVLVAAGYETREMLDTLRKAVSRVEMRSPVGYLIWPVDHPFLSLETVVFLCQAFVSNPDAVVRPTFNGHPGHPVLIPAWMDLDAADHGFGLAGVIRNQACTVIDLPVDDYAVLRNVNIPEDLEV